MDSSSNTNRLKLSEDTYKTSLRWGEWMSLMQLQKNNPKDSQSDFEPVSAKYLDHLNHFQITQTAIISSAMDDNEQFAKTIFLIEYHYDDSSKVIKTHHTIDWWYHEESNTWYTENLLPEEFNMKELKTFKLSPKRF
ncbi:MAG: hypothetical protein KZQ83_03665 [gamma proteobacterium symbiont of Taylorina sp.]|nr:hypothetical protein [gamma proteobacterium symbiont of Taylorina sp.]